MNKGLIYKQVLRASIVESNVEDENLSDSALINKT